MVSKKPKKRDPSENRAGDRAINPTPKVHIVQFGAGVQTNTKPEKDLPIAIALVAAKLYNDAIMGRHFLRVVDKFKAYEKNCKSLI
jgi:hypothetical protein